MSAPDSDALLEASETVSDSLEKLAALADAVQTLGSSGQRLAQDTLEVLGRMMVEHVAAARESYHVLDTLRMPQGAVGQ